MENRIKVMVFEPLKEPYIENIKNVPEAYKSIVEGETEEVRLDEKTLLICNSEGKEKELVPNRTIGNDIICGTFFLATDTGTDKYASITPMQAQFYNKRYGDAEVISQADVKYLSQIGSVGIGRDTVYLNNLSMRFNEEKIDFRKVAASYKTQDMHEAKELLKLMHDVFISTHKTDCVDDLDTVGDEFVSLPAVIKSDKTGEICVGLVYVDIESSGEHWGTQFALSYGFYGDDGESMPPMVKAERDRIGSYDYWYTPTFAGDIHVSNDNIPEDVQNMLDYAKGIEEQTQGMNMNLS